VKNGVLCGETQSGFEQGKEAALMAKEILSGATPSNLPVRMPKKGTLMIIKNSRQIRNSHSRRFKTKSKNNTLNVILKGEIYDKSRN